MRKNREMQNHLIWGHCSRGRGLEAQGMKDVGNSPFKMVECKERILNYLATEDRTLTVINKVVIK